MSGAIRRFLSMFRGNDAAVPAPVFSLPHVVIAPPVTGVLPGELTARDMDRLRGVHADLQRVVIRAAQNGAKFAVLEGLRSQARQAELVARGASRTMHSRHLTGHAVDLAATIHGEIRWDWPLYDRLAGQVKAAARDEGVAIEWGGDWTAFRDGPHWQLPWPEGDRRA